MARAGKREVKSKTFLLCFLEISSSPPPSSCMSVLFDYIKISNFPAVSDVFERICIPDNSFIIMGTTNAGRIMSGKYQALLGLNKPFSFWGWGRSTGSKQCRLSLVSGNPWFHLRTRSSDYRSHLLSPWKQEGLAWATHVWNSCCELLTLTMLHPGAQQARQTQGVLCEVLNEHRSHLCLCYLPIFPSLSTSLIYGSTSLVFKSTFQWNWWLRVICLNTWRLVIALGTLNEIWCCR